MRHLHVYLNKNYDDNENSKNVNSFIYEFIYIKQICNMKFEHIRFICRFHFIRDELKVSHFDREYVETFLIDIDFFFFYLLFINDFDIHKNMYRALKTFYFISDNLFYDERRKIVNVFTLILKSHDVALKNVVNAFAKFIKVLNKKTDLYINDQKQKMCAFVFDLIKNLFQQIDNSEFLRHNVQKSCRSCFVFKKVKTNLNFDIIINDRYHFEILNQREYATQLVDENQRMFLRKIELQLKTLVIDRLCSVLNLIQNKAYDVFHSKWKKFERILQSFLIEFIFFKREDTKYLKVFHNFRFFLDWSFIQSLKYYVWSWFLSKVERTSIFLSLILRCYVTIEWFRLFFLQVVEKILTSQNIFQRTIIKIFDIIVKSNTIVNNQRYTYVEQLHTIIMNAKKIYQNLIRCVMKFDEVFSINDVFKFEKIFFDDFVNENIFHNVNHEDFLNNEIFVDEKNFHHVDEKNFINNDFEEKNNSLIDVFFKTTISKFESKLNFLFISIKVDAFKKKEREKRQKREMIESSKSINSSHCLSFSMFISIFISQIWHASLKRSWTWTF